MFFTKKAFALVALSIATAFAGEEASVRPAFLPQPQAQISPEVLTNEGIVALANAGFSDQFIVEKIMISNRTRFDTSAEGLSFMRRNAIPEDLIEFIVEHAARPLFVPAPQAVAPVAVVATKHKTNKAVVPVAATTVAMTPTPVAAASVSVVSSVVAGMPVAPVTVTTPLMVRPKYLGAWNTVTPVMGGVVYNYAPVAYGTYAYPVQPVAPVVVGVPQAVPVAWWR